MNNSKGISIIEVLATIVILSIVAILTFGIISNANTEGNNQSKQNRELQSISYALKLITKDVRQSKSGISLNSNEIILNNSIDSTKNVIYKYNPQSKTLTRNSATIAINVNSFEILSTVTSLSITIENSKNEQVSTTLYYRKE